MKLYLSVIGGAMLAIAAANIAMGVAPWYYVIIAVVWCTALQFAIDGFIAIVINKLPNGWFGASNRLYHVTKKERALYIRLGVRLWKDKIWELGGLGGFSKKELKEPDNPEYIERFIIECNKGVLTHRLSYPVGFLAMLTLPGICAVTIALPVAMVNVFLNILPTVALRYNTPLLQSLLSRIKKRSADRQAVN